ncbi:polyprenyl synthetase family protein [Streptomyces sp. NPDC059271]|uniref:polyprenyl synthetase family protein n=1 Tax=Streptomyces sp. NPDC059271 TaxID=3346799 RepID=UPI0036C09670
MTPTALRRPTTATATPAVPTAPATATTPPVSAAATVAASPAATGPRTGTAPPDAPSILRRCRDLVAPALTDAIDGLHPWVAEMARYTLGLREAAGAGAGPGRGKGIRQALAVLGAEAVSGPGSAGVPGAVAVELVHTFSLLHDDIMDGDALRRGRPALWKAYGTGPAVLAGDALFALGVETLAVTPHAGSAVRQLTTTLGDLVGGQADDLLFAQRPWTGPEAVRAGEYLTMAERKTGALLGCALALGARLAGAPDHTAGELDFIGRHLGVAFQIADDVLGIWGEPERTGKPVHGDLRQGKKTLPVLAALDAAPGGGELAELLTAPGALDGDGARRAATLVERAGGRTRAEHEARRHLAEARTRLTALRLAPGPVGELGTLLSALAGRTV